MRVWLVPLFVILASLAASAADDWQRIVCIDDPRLTVTLLVKAVATPADEEFVGFELNNKTGAPLDGRGVASYRLEDLWISTINDDAPVRRTRISGNVYDLLWREGDRVLPKRGRRDDSVPAGVVRSTRYSSAYAFNNIGWPMEQGWMVAGRAHIEVGMPDRTVLTSPREGIPFRFEWRPPDTAGMAALRQRLKQVLATPKEPLGDAHVLRMLLSHKEVAPAVTVHDLLAGLKRHEYAARPVIREHLNSLYPTDEVTIQFWLEAIRSRDRALLQELAEATQIRDARLIEPLMAWLRQDREPYHPSHFAMMVLKRHRDLMTDRRAITAELGKTTFGRLMLFPKGEFPEKKERWRWNMEIEKLALTGDEFMIPRLLSFLDRKDVVLDARDVAAANNGVSTRACDLAYNAILDLLDRPDARFTMGLGHLADPQPPLEQEYAWRDHLIAELKAELSKPK